jgi:heat shock protein HslJ
MLCTQPRLMDQEKDFLDALDEAKSCKVVSGKLNITADDGMLLVLSAA